MIKDCQAMIVNHQSLFITSILFIFHILFEKGGFRKIPENHSKNKSSHVGLSGPPEGEGVVPMKSGLL